MNIQLIDNQIARCEGQIESLTERLPYADGGAYSQDKQRISELRTELAQWQELRAEVAACEEFRISSNIHQTNRELAEQQSDKLLEAFGSARQLLVGVDGMSLNNIRNIAGEELEKIDAAIASVQGGAE